MTWHSKRDLENAIERLEENDGTLESLETDELYMIALRGSEDGSDVSEERAEAAWNEYIRRLEATVEAYDVDDDDRGETA